jgi:hypothetical protein
MHGLCPSHSCKVCAKEFRRKESVKRHMRIQHPSFNRRSQASGNPTPADKFREPTLGPASDRIKDLIDGARALKGLEAHLNSLLVEIKSVLNKEIDDL